MLLQTNSYIVPNDKREEHARLMRRVRQVLARLGCDHFEVYEQLGADWRTQKPASRFVQMMMFRGRDHHRSVQEAERNDAGAQELIQEFCQLVDFADQQQKGLVATGYYGSIVGSGLRDQDPIDQRLASDESLDKVGMNGEADRQAPNPPAPPAPTPKAQP